MAAVPAARKPRGKDRTTALIIVNVQVRGVWGTPFRVCARGPRLVCGARVRRPFPPGCPLLATNAFAASSHARSAHATPRAVTAERLHACGRVPD
jgi:hypothetical protein